MSFHLPTVSQDILTESYRNSVIQTVQQNSLHTMFKILRTHTFLAVITKTIFNQLDTKKRSAVILIKTDFVTQSYL